MRGTLRSVLVSLLCGALGALAVLWFSGAFNQTSAASPGLELTPVGLTHSADSGSVIRSTMPTRVRSFEEEFIDAAKIASPTVVHVHTMSEVEQANPFRGSIIEFFFGPQPSQRRPVLGSGSGVIVSTDGYIITNNHVIEGAQVIEVTLTDQQKYTAKLLARDPAIDLALLKIEPERAIQAIEFGDSESLQVGNWVLAIGNPFNLENTVTAGIVSAISRNINMQSGRMSMESLIQIDAAVNPGNSGGALVDLDGRLVGINTAIFSPTGTFAGYAFSIPETVVRSFLEDALSGKLRERGFLGVHLTEMTEYLAERLTGGEEAGVVIAGVFRTGPAARAGVRPGDVVLEVNGKVVNTVTELQECISSKSAGEEVELKIQRGSQRGEVKVRLAGQGDFR